MNVRDGGKFTVRDLNIHKDDILEIRSLLLGGSRHFTDHSLHGNKTKKQKKRESRLIPSPPTPPPSPTPPTTYSTGLQNVNGNSAFNTSWQNNVEARQVRRLIDRSTITEEGGRMIIGIQTCLK